jgi:hypothetical protein
LSQCKMPQFRLPKYDRDKLVLLSLEVRKTFSQKLWPAQNNTKFTFAKTFDSTQTYHIISLDPGLYSAGFGSYLWQVWSISG